MRTLIKNCLVVMTTALLFGCATTSNIENVQTVTGVARPIDSLVMVILEPGSESEERKGSASGEAAKAAAEARDSVEIYLRTRFPVAFAAAGIPSTLIHATKLDQNTVGSVGSGQKQASHLLVLQRARVSSSCTSYSCKSDVYLVVTLFDTVAKKTAWSSRAFVGDKSFQQKIGAENLDELAGKLLTQLKTDGFIK